MVFVPAAPSNVNTAGMVVFAISAARNAHIFIPEISAQYAEKRRSLQSITCLDLLMVQTMPAKAIMLMLVYIALSTVNW